MDGGEEYIGYSEMYQYLNTEEGEDDDCVILDGNPDKAAVEDKNPVSPQEEEEDDCIIVSEKGPVACRDYPHSRHLCVQFPFDSTPHSDHCKLCHCYACDSPAPCAYWANGISLIDHCHATDLDEVWKFERRRIREWGKQFLNIETIAKPTRGQVGETVELPQPSVTCDGPNLSRSPSSYGFSEELTSSSNQPSPQSTIPCNNKLQETRVSTSHAATSSIARPRPLGRLGDVNLMLPHQYSSDMSSNKRISTPSLDEVTPAQLYGQPRDEAYSNLHYTTISNSTSHAATSSIARPRPLRRLRDVNLISQHQYSSYMNSNRRISTTFLDEVAPTQLYGQSGDEASSTLHYNTISNSTSHVATSIIFKRPLTSRRPRARSAGWVGDVNHAATFLFPHQYSPDKNMYKRIFTPSLGELTRAQLYGQPGDEASSNLHYNTTSNSTSHAATSSIAFKRPQTSRRPRARSSGRVGDVDLLSPHQYLSNENTNKRMSTSSLGEVIPAYASASGPFLTPHKMGQDDPMTSLYSKRPCYGWIDEEDDDDDF